ncbi:YjbF family lipoprotein [Gammaproteobacteria bacterium]|nr:YjbF family lipoprotein [Gammaproteobacteria bacterium]
MIKYHYLLLIILLSSCSIIDYELSGIISLKSKDVSIDEINNLNYDINIIKFNNDDELIFKLDNIRNGISSWSAEDNIMLKSKNGKIIKSSNLEYDFEIINYRGFKIDLADYSTYLKFKDPDSGFLEIFFSYELIKTGVKKKRFSNSSYKYSLIKEEFRVPLISWVGSNYYWVDEDNYVIETKQTIDPFGKKVRMELIKK